MGKRDKGPWDSLLSGLVFGAGFGVFWALHPTELWPIFPIVLLGVLPFVNGARRLVAARRPRLSASEREAIEEKEVLRIARDSRGTVTPGLVALESDLTATQAEETLQRMTRKGYASMRVTDDGRVQYEFPEFMRGLEQ